jgi:Fe-S cluster biogenesis protein NfuA
LSLEEKVNAALDEIRPHLAGDGGSIELLEITKDNIAMVKWLGTCEFCSMSIMTMKAGVEQAIKTKAPEITEVIAVNGIYATADEEK